MNVRELIKKIDNCDSRDELQNLALEVMTYSYEPNADPKIVSQLRNKIWERVNYLNQEEENLKAQEYKNKNKVKILQPIKNSSVSDKAGVISVAFLMTGILATLVMYSILAFAHFIGR